MLSATRAKELRYAQCVYLAASTAWSTAEISAITGLEEKSVSTVLGNYRKYGESAILCEDLGYTRRHAALSLSDETTFLDILADEHATGRSVTASHAWEYLQNLFGDKHHKDLVYSIFQRHGWTATGRNGQWEGYFIPPSTNTHDTTRPSVSSSSCYVPQNVDKRIPHARPAQRLLSSEQETVVVEALKARLARNQSVTVKDGQSIAKARCKVPISNKTMRRILLRHGWTQLRHGGHAMWVVGDTFSEDALFDDLMDRHNARLLTSFQNTDVSLALESAMAHGEPVTAKLAQTHMEQTLGIHVSRNAAANFLLRNRWQRVSKRRRIFWVKGDHPDLVGLSKRYSPSNGRLTYSQEEDFVKELALEHANGTAITPRHALALLQARIGTAHMSLIFSIFARNGWTPIGSPGRRHRPYAPPCTIPVANDVDT